MEEEQTEAKERNWGKILSPCILASIFSLLAVIASLIGISASGGWSFIGVIIYFPFLLVFLLLDWIIKLIVKENMITLWLVETGVIILAIIVYQVFIS